VRSLIIPALVLAFTVYCLIDVIRSEDSDIRGLPKLAWVFIVLLFPVAGGAAWFLAGRPRGTKPPGTDRITRPKPRVLGPDDDPDFLRTIRRPTAAPPATPDDPAVIEDGPADGASSEPPSARPTDDRPTDDMPTDEHGDSGERDDRRS